MKYGFNQHKITINAMFLKNNFKSLRDVICRKTTIIYLCDKYKFYRKQKFSFCNVALRICSILPLLLTQRYTESINVNQHIYAVKFNANFVIINH